MNGYSCVYFNDLVCR